MAESLSAISWEPVLAKSIKLNVQTQVAPTKGNLVYEYNPFRNFRLTKNMYEYKENLYSAEELDTIYHITMTSDKKEWLMEGVKMTSEQLPVLREKGELVDFITTDAEELNFDLRYPVNMVALYSYDGSVNLIINDGLNPPKLINSRFSATGRNTYEVIDRKGNNDTNIYDLGEAFKIDTSLYKSVNNIPKLSFTGCSFGGQLKVGNYFFYFKLSDADGNETDFVAESGLVSVFIGFDDPLSITTGLKNENSFKNVSFLLENIDIAYDYVYVYYSRTTAEGQENAITEYKKIERKFTVNNTGACNILVTGYEETTDLTAADINLSYNIVDAAKALVVCQNMLFMGNVHKPEIPYEELSDLSLRFLPYIHEERYPLEMDEHYDISSTEKGYYDPQYIYEKTGYWENELYRLGIVYILPNGELSPVFNIRGGIDILEYANADSKYAKPTCKISFNKEAKEIKSQDTLFAHYPVYDEEGKRYKIKYNETTYYLFDSDYSNTEMAPSVRYENCKGVVRFKATSDTNTVHGLDIRVDLDTINELKKYVKGYFFVRQKRIPTILALGITIGIDKESRLPTVPTAGGFLEEIADSLEKTHVTTANINDVNYVSEGFLNRYSFHFKKKSSSLWGKIGAAVGVAVLVAAAVVATIYTGGAFAAVAAAGASATLATATTAGAAALAIGSMSALTVAGIAVGGAAVVTAAAMATAGAIQEVRYAYSSAFDTRKLDGRNTKVPSGYKLVENDESRQLTGDFYDRVIIKDPSANKVLAILCPDYEVNPAYYNQVFTGNDHLIQLTHSLNINGLAGRSYNYFTNDLNHFYVPQYYDMNLDNAYTFKIVGVEDNLPIAGIGETLYRARAGNAEEPWTYECIAEDYKSDYSKHNADEDEETTSNKKINGDIVRGSFGPYLAFNDENNKFSPAETVNIFIPKYSSSKMLNYIDIRMHDDSEYKAISDRIGIKNLEDYSVEEKSLITQNKREYIEYGYTHKLFRGDCYICLFTHRMNRNFNAPSAPYNDEIVDTDTWRDNYDPDSPDKYAEINLGDIDAVKLGMWVTFRVRSANNLNIRTLDSSYVDEEAQTGRPRGYYPYFSMDTGGNNKKPDACVFNKGFNIKLSERWNFGLPDVPYIKNWFGTRIMYSDIHINDAYTNGFRVFRGTAFKDYTRAYGEIVKLETLGSNIICVFEHGVAVIPVNERAVAGQGAGGPVYINTSNVLGEPRIISDCYGTQWADSVLKVPRAQLTSTGTTSKTGDSDGSYWIYGVDTVAKKIWRTDGSSITCISDFKVQEFLNNNITLGERETMPILGVRNVKTFYNAYKHDVMFTFYDNTYGFEEKAWNLCWNELLQKFVTFYSWIPSFMENINNVPFSFDRNVSKWIAKLGTSHTENSFADGITCSNVLLNNYFLGGAEGGAVVNDFSYEVKVLMLDGTFVTKILTVPESSRDSYIGVLSLKNRVLPDTNLFYNILYSLERDPWANYEIFEIRNIGNYIIPDKIDGLDTKYPGKTVPIYALYFRQPDSIEEKWGIAYTDDIATEPAYHTSVADGNEAVYRNIVRGPEDLMSELYYRNKAGHAYADYDTNKITYDIITEEDDVEVYDDDLYPISEVETIIAKDYYGYTDSEVEQVRKWIESGRGNSETALRLTSGKVWTHAAMLKSSGGPFDYNTPIYLQYASGLQPCGGPLGHMVEHPELHAPWKNHYLTKAQMSVIVATRKLLLDYPIFKDLTGKRPMLPRHAENFGGPEQINPDRIVAMLMIKADIKIEDDSQQSLSDTYYNMKASMNSGTSLIDAGQYESTIGITTKWNMQFLTSDFWKHGQAGLIDIADDIYPTYWYGKQHPFEFEFMVVNDPSIHKIFTNLEIIANKAKPESFHYEVIGEAYDFAKDKANMYFRQEALKALWQYNGLDIEYNRNFLKVKTQQNPKSADLLRIYYGRQNPVNEIEDYYVHIQGGMFNGDHDYRHLSGGEIVYYPTRLEFRVSNHVKAIDVDDLPDTSPDSFGGRGLIASNMRYLEDRWRVTINPLLVVYKNEYLKGLSNTTWASSYNNETLLPPLPIYNSPIPGAVKAKHQIDFPGLGSTVSSYDRSNALYHLYNLSSFAVNGNYAPLDITNWVNDSDIYGTMFGAALNRKETDMRDKVMKVRIRYSGEDLAVIDWINTIYQISYA